MFSFHYLPGSKLKTSARLYLIEQPLILSFELNLGQVRSTEYRVRIGSRLPLVGTLVLSTERYLSTEDGIGSSDLFND